MDQKEQQMQNNSQSNFGNVDQSVFENLANQNMEQDRISYQIEEKKKTIDKMVEETIEDNNKLKTEKYKEIDKLTDKQKNKNIQWKNEAEKKIDNKINLEKDKINKTKDSLLKDYNNNPNKNSLIGKLQKTAIDKVDKKNEQLEKQRIVEKKVVNNLTEHRNNKIDSLAKEKKSNIRRNTLSDNKKIETIGQKYKNNIDNNLGLTTKKTNPTKITDISSNLLKNKEMSIKTPIESLKKASPIAENAIKEIAVNAIKCATDSVKTATKAAKDISNVIR